MQAIMSEAGEADKATERAAGQHLQPALPHRVQSMYPPSLQEGTSICATSYQSLSVVARG